MATYQEQLAAATVFDVIDVNNGGVVVETFSTRRKALNYTNKLEPVPTLSSGWRYVISPRRLYEV